MDSGSFESIIADVLVERVFQGLVVESLKATCADDLV